MSWWPFGRKKPVKAVQSTVIVKSPVDAARVAFTTGRPVVANRRDDGDWDMNVLNPLSPLSSTIYDSSPSSGGCSYDSGSSSSSSSDSSSCSSSSSDSGGGSGGGSD